VGLRSVCGDAKVRRISCVVAELKAVFDGLGEEVDPQIIDNLVFLADEDGNGTIEWEEVSIAKRSRDICICGRSDGVWFGARSFSRSSSCSRRCRWHNSRGCSRPCERGISRGKKSMWSTRPHKKKKPRPHPGHQTRFENTMGGKCFDFVNAFLWSPPPPCPRRCCRLRDWFIVYIKIYRVKYSSIPFELRGTLVHCINNVKHPFPTPGIQSPSVHRPSGPSGRGERPWTD
jgi:hypothetical protein